MLNLTTEEKKERHRLQMKINLLKYVRSPESQLNEKIRMEKRNCYTKEALRLRRILLTI